MEVVSLKGAPLEFRAAIARELGYEVQEDGIHLTKDGQQALDPYSHAPLRLDNIAVLPGSVVLLDNNPVSIACYLEDYGDIL